MTQAAVRRIEVRFEPLGNFLSLVDLGDRKRPDHAGHMTQTVQWHVAADRSTHFLIQSHCAARHPINSPEVFVRQRVNRGVDRFALENEVRAGFRPVRFEERWKIIIPLPKLTV